MALDLSAPTHYLRQNFDGTNYSSVPYASRAAAEAAGPFYISEFWTSLGGGVFAHWARVRDLGNTMLSDGVTPNPYYEADPANRNHAIIPVWLLGGSGSVADATAGDYQYVDPGDTNGGFAAGAGVGSVDASVVNVGGVPSATWSAAQHYYAFDVDLGTAVLGPWEEINRVNPGLPSDQWGEWDLPGAAYFNVGAGFLGGFMSPPGGDATYDTGLEARGITLTVGGSSVTPPDAGYGWSIGLGLPSGVR